MGKKGIFPSNGKGFPFEVEGAFLRRKGDFPSNKKKFPSEEAGPCLREETIFLAVEGSALCVRKGGGRGGLSGR